MGTNLIGKNAKSIVTDDGIELLYCEFGEQNEEVLVMGYFYYHSVLPLVEELAKRFHVYGVVMRMNGKGTQFNDDGSIHWARQWGDDVYQVAKKLGLKKFHYFGKCHGVIPGWYLIKEYPGMLETFSSTYMVPHIAGGVAKRWLENLRKPPAERTPVMRVLEKAYIKQDEINKLNSGIGRNANQNMADSPSQAIASQYASCPERLWGSVEECEEFLKNINIPVLLMFGTEDILFQDFETSNFKAMTTINRAKTVLLQGERHLLEIDCPERMASEIIFFIDESKKNYD